MRSSPLDRAKAAMTECGTHLDVTNQRGTEVEAYLVVSVLVTLGARFEEITRGYLIVRACRNADPDARQFTQWAVKRVVRSTKVDEITTLLKRFNPTHASEFHALVSEQAIAAYGNIVTNRHRVAHGFGSNMTLAEVDKSIPLAEAVLDAVTVVLGLADDEVRSVHGQ